MKLTIIIVNYNVKYFLEQALYAVRRAATRVSCEVYVVDNNSVDDSVRMVREKFPEVILIANKENTGFSKANNQAIAVAKGEYVLLLNPDTVVEEDTFEKTCNFMDSRPDVGGLGVKMIDGTGSFLPESKRGFPAPDVAFYKTFGLSKLFPKSKVFNRYHLGYLDKDQNHEIDVLSGAFMLMRKDVLEKIGYLDEDFFMYGEDIDLSYRITKAGYKNYYFADSCIIHYKGESTKKGSLNYVKTFYQAMIIFAQKHFTGRNANLFIFMLEMAIWLRAGVTLITNITRKVWLPLLDILLLYGGLYMIKNTWEQFRYGVDEYFDENVLWVNFPLYITVWLLSVWLSGGYDSGGNRHVLRGIFLGTIANAAVYGFLGTDFRSSRMLIVLGAVWALFAMILLRLTYNFFKEGRFALESDSRHHIVIVGNISETERVLALLQKAQVEMNFIGRVEVEEIEPETSDAYYIGNLNKLADIVYMYKADEIIFCSQNISSQEIIRQMSLLGSQINYKIVPEGSLSIIGSNSKDSAGDLYTIELKFKISAPPARRSKRLLDIAFSVLFLLLLPLLIVFIKNKLHFIKSIFQVLSGKKSWVGYCSVQEQKDALPRIKNGVFTPLDALPFVPDDQSSLQRLDLFYAKDYTVERDLEIIGKGVFRV